MPNIWKLKEFCYQKSLKYLMIYTVTGNLTCAFIAIKYQLHILQRFCIQKLQNDKFASVQYSLQTPH